MVLNLFKIFDINLFSGGITRKQVASGTAGKLSLEWKVIDQGIASGQPSQLRQAIISADKTVDIALKELTSGETMGERLKNAKELFDKDLYNRIWEAHKMRNMLVHEIGYEPPHFMITKSVADLRTAVKSLGVKI